MLFMKKFLTSTGWLLVFFCLKAQNPNLIQQSVASPNAPGGRIYFYQYKPTLYNNTDLFPLIISLHGGGEAGPDGGGSLTNVINFGLPQLVNGANAHALEFTWQGKTEGFIMLAPQTNPTLVNSWPTYYVDEMITYAVNNLRVDPNRIFLTGYSLGGKGVWLYATSSTTTASKLAGIIPAAAIAVGSANFCNISASKVATWVQHSFFDEFGGVSEAISYTNSINACSPVVPAVDTIYHSGSHGIYMQKTYDFTNGSHYPNLFQWMLKVNRNLNPATNANPVPVIAGPAVINLTAPVNTSSLPVLDGSGSFDSDDIIMDYLWEQTTGSTLLPAPSSPSDLNTDQVRQWPVVKIPLNSIGVPVGSYTFRLRVKDYLSSKAGHTQFATKTINVSMPASGHAGPATYAGPDFVLGPTETTVVKQSGTYQLLYGGTGVTGYNWRFLTGPQTATVSGFNGGPYPGGDNNASFTNTTAPGVYTFEFSATSNLGDIGRDTFSITRLSGALPVDYAYINGKNAGSKNVISWATTAEINSDRFDIMRSSDGINFTLAGSIHSKGGATVTTYTFDDTNAPFGISYYRLSQVDKDGHVSLSKIIAINNPKTGIYIEKYPNPVHDNLTIIIQGNTNGSSQLVIADMQGKTILQQQWQKDQQLLKKVVNVATLQNGVYQVIITIGQEKQVSSFVKY